jgi:hypothetical protein
MLESKREFELVLGLTSIVSDSLYDSNHKIYGLILLSFSFGRNHFVHKTCDWLLAATQRERRGLTTGSRHTREERRCQRDRTRATEHARQKRSRHTRSGSLRDTRDGQRRPRVTLATPGDARHTRD